MDYTWCRGTLNEYIMHTLPFHFHKNTGCDIYSKGNSVLNHSGALAPLLTVAILLGDPSGCKSPMQIITAVFSVLWSCYLFRIMDPGFKNALVPRFHGGSGVAAHCSLYWSFRTLQIKKVCQAVITICSRWPHPTWSPSLQGAGGPVRQKGLIFRPILDFCFFKKPMSPQDTGRRL